MINDKNKHSWCANAYMNLSVHPNGGVKACCMSQKWYETSDGKITLNSASIIDFWNGPTRQDFIKKMESGERVPECVACWREEEAGIASKRIRDNQTYADRKLDKDSLPIVLDLSMGNLCNLKCRICKSSHSSLWLREEAEVMSPNDIKGYMKLDQFRVGTESFNKNNNYVWEDIRELLSSAEHFDFAGGEPFYIDAHWKIVDYLVDNGYSKKQYIHYNTNGTIYPEKHIHKLDTFHTVDIQISSDGIGKKFNYLRHGTSFETCEQTLDKFLDIQKNGNAIWYVGVCLSLSSFNVFDFFETYEHYAKKGLRIYVNIVHDHNSVKILPRGLKKQLIAKIKRTKSFYAQDDWNLQKTQIIKLLSDKKEYKQEWTDFCTELSFRDKVRNENFAKVFPEYYNILKDYVYV